MAMSVEVPVSLLEVIFRLLAYLDDIDDCDCLHFQKAGYSPRFEHDNALWELKLKIKQLQGQIVDTYLLTVDDVTEYEKHDLKEWIAGGNSVFDNPYSIYNGSGLPMDFINGCRVGFDMYCNPSDFVEGAASEGSCGNWDNDDLPF